MNEGIALTVCITGGSFLVPTLPTAVGGKQPQDATKYYCYYLCPEGAVVATKLSKIWQIVEYLKVLYR